MLKHIVNTYRNTLLSSLLLSVIFMTNGQEEILHRDVDQLNALDYLFLGLLFFVVYEVSRHIIYGLRKNEV